MERFLLDTNHLSPLLTQGETLLTQILNSMEQGNQFFICSPALSEFLFGLNATKRAADNYRRWQYLEHRFIYLDIDKQDAKQAADLRWALRRRGWQLGFVDALIAVVAMRYGLTLLTTDKDFTAVSGLSQENWR